MLLAPARVLLAVPDKTIDGAVRSLKLEKNPYSPASRTVRPTVSLVAFQLSHQNLQNKLLIGCEYAHQAAAQWVDAGM